MTNKEEKTTIKQKMKNTIPDWLKDDKSIVFYAENPAPKIKCSDEEKRIYGVEFKQSEGVCGARAMVSKKSFHDSRKVFYEVDISQRFWCIPIPAFFADKKEAIRFVEDELKRIKEEESLPRK